MTSTNTLRIKLRMLLNDRESKTFTDDELDSLLNDADCIYCAASEGWTIKASMQENNDTPNQYQVGQERYQYSTAADIANLAYKNAEKYKGMCTGRVSIVLNADVDVGI